MATNDDPAIQQISGGLSVVVKFVILPLVVLALVGGVALRVLGDEENRDRVRKFEREDAAHRCDPPVGTCRDLAAKTFRTAPVMPPESTEAYRFLGGNATERYLMLEYAHAENRDDELVVVIARRGGPGLGEPPVDQTSLLTAPNGRRYAEQTESDGVTRLDWWDDAFHYMVSMQQSVSRDSVKYRAALGVVIRAAA